MSNRSFDGIAATTVVNKPISGDAVTTLRSHTPRYQSGETNIDVDVLVKAGITNLTPYGEEAPLDCVIFVGPR